jgi:Phosphotransferase enzyme family
MLRLPVPETPEEVTPDWLTAVLNEGGVRVGRVTDAQWLRVGAEYGFTGLVGRVRLRYDGAAAGSPRSVIVKLPTAQGDDLSGYRTSLARDPALLRRHYERCVREARFYRELSVPFAPRLYYAGVDDGRRRVALVLEDARGRQGDVLRGCSVDDATLVLDELAPFHARWWGQHARRSGFPRLVGDPQARQVQYGRQVDRFLEEHGGGLPPAVSSICERLRSRLAAVAASLTAGRRTLIHADLHLDNMIFDGRGDGRSVVVLDWQTV